MKLFRHWVKIQEEIKVNGVNQKIATFGGSNISPDDAARRAREKISVIQRKIEGDKSAFEDYQVEIREEIVAELDAKNIITRNRYGALVLNSENILMIDIDDAVYSLFDLFKARADKKQKILEMIDKKSAAYRGLIFRVYETSNGFRVLVLGRDFSAKSHEADSIMKDFNADKLYATLCQKQDCFRARLTPKPSRAKVKKYRVIYPRDAEQEAAFNEWVKDYDYASARYSSCKFIKSIGGDMRGPVVEYHDRMTRAYEGLSLA
jgi:hypothetical protein